MSTGKYRRRVKAVVREAEDRFGTKLSQISEWNRKRFGKEVKGGRRGEQGSRDEG